jgi:hypothetical protein
MGKIGVQSGQNNARHALNGVKMVERAICKFL